MALAYLHSSLAQVDPPGQLLTDESIRIVGPLEHPLQSSELTRRECRSVAARLLPLPVVTVQYAVLLCNRRAVRGKQCLCGTADWLNYTVLLRS